MRGGWVVYFDLRSVAVPREGALRAIVEPQRHDEIVDADQAPRHRSARSRDADGDRRAAAPAAASAARRHQPALLQLLRIRIARRDAFQVACWRMAARALGLEVSLSRFGVPHQDTDRRIARGIVPTYSKTVNVGRDVGNL